MKILILSDSHGLTEELLSIRNKHEHEVSQFIHCGDSELSADNENLSGFAAVRGNCDFESKFPEDLLLEAAGRKMLVTHGHKYGVKSSIMSLSYRAKELAADIVCFGHSHILGAEMIDGILFINPGSIRLPRGRKERTYVILELNDREGILHVYDVEEGIINDLSHSFSFAV